MINIALAAAYVLGVLHFATVSGQNTGWSYPVRAVRYLQCIALFWPISIPVTYLGLMFSPVGNAIHAFEKWMDLPNE